MKRFLNVIVRIILIPVLFLGILGLSDLLFATQSLEVEIYLRSPDCVSLTYRADGRYTTVRPSHVFEDAGDRYLLTFAIPKKSTGIYTLNLGADNTAVRLGGMVMSSLLRSREVGAVELAVLFTEMKKVDSFSVNSINDTYMINASEGNAELTNTAPVEGYVIEPLTLLGVGAVSILLALLIGGMLLPADGKKPLPIPVKRVLLGVGGCLTAVFVFGAVVGGMPQFELDNAVFENAAIAVYRNVEAPDDGGPSLKEQLAQQEAEKEAAAEKEREEQAKEDAANNVYDDTVVYPMGDGSGDNSESYNQPKVTKWELVREGFKYDNVHVGKTDENGTTWYFYNDEFAEFCGYNKANDRDLTRLAKRFTKYAEDLASLGVEFYIVICPNKSTVYPEYVPSNSGWFATTHTKLDQVYEYLSENTALNLIDVRPALTAAKEVDFPLYYEYDTHWNNYGGFAAYGEIMRVISEKFPTVRIRQREDYRITLQESYMKDQLWYLGYYNKFSSIGPVFTPLEPSGTTLLDITSNEAAGIFRYQYEYPDGFVDWNKYSKFFNPALEEAGAPSVYVLRDSFGISLTYFIRESFSTSVFSLTQGELPSISTVMKEQPDIVIYEIAERNLAVMFSQ